MQAYRISRHGGPEVLEWLGLPDPQPRADEALIRVRACALNHLDLWVRRGVEGVTYPLPLIPGSEIAGEIQDTGELVQGLEPGRPVLIAPGVSCGQCDRCVAAEDMYCRDYGILGEHRDGGYAGLVAVPARNVLPLPRGLSYVEAAALPLVFMTAWRMLTARAALQPLEDVLIHAAGSGVSSAAIQIARLLGARHIIATAGGEAKLERALELGATHALDYRTADWPKEARGITGGKGVDVVVDHVGGEVFEQSLRALGWAGRVVLCGATARPDAKINLRAVFWKSLSILGSTMGSMAELRTLLRHVEAGRLRPVVDRTLPLAEAPAAQELLERREQFGKIVLTVGDEQVAQSVPAS
jgi:NADPH:quinone reductase-like Zn-dependent oxidoreductase